MTEKDPKKDDLMLLLLDYTSGELCGSKEFQGTREHLELMMAEDDFRKAYDGWTAILADVLDNPTIKYESLRDKAAKLLKAQDWTEEDIQQALCTCDTQGAAKASTEPAGPLEEDAGPTPVPETEHAAGATEIPENWETFNAQELRKLARKVTRQNTSRWNKEACVYGIRKKIAGEQPATTAAVADPLQAEDPATPVPIPPPAMPSVGAGPPPTALEPPSLPAPVASSGIPAPPPPPPPSPME